MSQPFKVYNSMVFVNSQICATITKTNFGTFSSPQKKTQQPNNSLLSYHPLTIHTPIPKPPLTYFLCP